MGLEFPVFLIGGAEVLEPSFDSNLVFAVGHRFRGRIDGPEALLARIDHQMIQRARSRALLNDQLAQLTGLVHDRSDDYRRSVIRQDLGPEISLLEPSGCDVHLM